MPAKLSIQDVSFAYPTGEKTPPLALSHICLEIQEGEFVCLLGPSGCGKSTLLSLLMGLNHQDEGNITLDGKALLGPGNDRGVVFQHYSLFPWLTAEGNISFAIAHNGKKSTRAERGKKARE